MPENAAVCPAMVKAKFGDSLTKTDTGRTNEVLGKVVAHNLCVLVQAVYELGVEVDLRGTEALEVDLGT